MTRSLLYKTLFLVAGSATLVAMFAFDTTVVPEAAAADPKPNLNKPIQAEFPPRGEVEFERSVIRLPLTWGNVNNKPLEIIELTAFMRLERERPTRNAIGYRQFEFTIREWELFGYSEVLRAHISFAASKDVVQPKSLAVALQKGADYPALIVYNAIYDIYIDGRKILSQRPGVAMARGVMEIPPRNITVAFQKPFSVHADKSGLLVTKHVEGCLEEGIETPEYCFCGGTCEDMSTISAEEFESGLREARAIRERLATLKPKPVPKDGAAAAGARGRSKTD